MEDKILDKVREKAAALYKDEKDVNDFMQGFMDKVANAAKASGKESFFSREKLTEGFSTQLGRASAAGLVGAGMYGIAALVGQVKDHTRYNNFLKALNEAVQMNRILKNSDKDKVVNFAHTIYKFAPSVATDPNMLSSILANAIQGEGIDPMTVRTLTDLESRYHESKSFSPKQWM